MTQENAPTRAPRIIGYARVSTKRQNLAMQRNALRKAGCEIVFCDHGVSGKIFPRKGLSKALAILRAGDTLVVYKQDRLGRVVLELARLLEFFLDNHIQLLSLTQAMDITTSNGRLIFHFNSVLAEHESDQTGERTRDGIGARKAQGARFGRKPKLTATQAIAAKKMLETPEMSMAATARAFKVSPHTIKRSIESLEVAA